MLIAAFTYDLHAVNIVCIPSLLGIEPPIKFSKRMGLMGFQFLEGVVGKKGAPFLGVCSF